MNMDNLNNLDDICNEKFPNIVFWNAWNEIDWALNLKIFKEAQEFIERKCTSFLYTSSIFSRYSNIPDALLSPRDGLSSSRTTAGLAECKLLHCPSSMSELFSPSFHDAFAFELLKLPALVDFPHFLNYMFLLTTITNIFRITSWMDFMFCR